MNLSAASITWNGLTIHGGRGPGHRFTFDSLDGWEGFDTRYNPLPRPASHGEFDSPARVAGRRVLATGNCSELEARDELLRELGAALTPSSGLQDLVISHAGRTLTSSARLVRFRAFARSWGAGTFGWAAEWYCPDPLRYAERVSGTTGFPTRTGGLRFPLYSDGAGANVGALDYGEVSASGRVELTNDGTADSWPQFEVQGPVSPEGFEIITVGTGARLVFEGPVPAGSQLVLDAATGTAVIDGVADRGGRLTWRDWAPVPAGGVSEFAFVPRGAFTPAVLTASVRPAFW